jgi:hypothetical protein
MEGENQTEGEAEDNATDEMCAKNMQLFIEKGISLCNFMDYIVLNIMITLSYRY